MSRPLVIPYAERDGRLVHVSEVARGLACDCVCPACRCPVVARKGSQTTHHFAHVRDSTCRFDVVLHELGRRLLESRLKAAVARAEPVKMTWECTTCYDTHVGDLAKTARTAVAASTSAGRPHIALHDAADKTIARIEIVMGHRRWKRVRARAQDAPIPLVVFGIESIEDLDRLVDDDVLEPILVTLCTRRKCQECGAPMYQKRLHVVDGSCWRCLRPMKVAFLELEGYVSGPESFSRDLISLASRRGVILRVKHSRTQSRRYLANTCGHCDSFIGQHYLPEYCESPDDMTAANAVHVGLLCPSCGASSSGPGDSVCP